jgi:uncharacterized protein YpmB
MTKTFLLAGAISTPSDNELIIGLVLLLIIFIVISLVVGWGFSKFYSVTDNKRRKAFRMASAITMILLVTGFLAFCFYFIF